MPNDMPIGLCCVCKDPLNHSNAGFCKTCGQPFCWGVCGNWQDGEHRCNNCMEPEDSYEDNWDDSPGDWDINY